MNETHRGCRSPGGFFYALWLTVANSVEHRCSVAGVLFRGGQTFVAD